MDDVRTVWRPEPDSNRRMTVLQTVALANLAIGPDEDLDISLYPDTKEISISDGGCHAARLMDVRTIIFCKSRYISHLGVVDKKSFKGALIRNGLPKSDESSRVVKNGSVASILRV